MKDMLFGIEMLAFYGIILGFAFWELWKVSKLTDKNKTDASDRDDAPDE
ncbi:MAG: hypothetical protein AAFQ22_01330 [Pseudomonadota bacterium]